MEASALIPRALSGLGGSARSLTDQGLSCSRPLRPKPVEGVRAAAPPRVSRATPRWYVEGRSSSGRLTRRSIGAQVLQPQRDEGMRGWSSAKNTARAPERIHWAQGRDSAGRPGPTRSRSDRLPQADGGGAAEQGALFTAATRGGRRCRAPSREVNAIGGRGRRGGGGRCRG